MLTGNYFSSVNIPSFTMIAVIDHQLSPFTDLGLAHESIVSNTDDATERCRISLKRDVISLLQNHISSSKKDNLKNTV